MRQRAGLASGHLQKSRGKERARQRGKSSRVKGSKEAKEPEQESRFVVHTGFLARAYTRSLAQKYLSRQGGKEFTHCSL